MEHKVLIVEDDLSIARLIKLNLNLAGYLTESVEDGLLAFERIQKEKFDLILHSRAVGVNAERGRKNTKKTLKRSLHSWSCCAIIQKRI